MEFYTKNSTEGRWYLRNVSAFEGGFEGVFRPKTQDEVVAIVKEASERGVKLYPISQGKNWGLGSKLPSDDNCCILDLSGLNRILEYNEEYGYLVIEPGVTQQQIYDFLSAKKSPYYLDVTGSGAETSIVGNALERGIAYNTHRAEVVHSFKVLTGNGDVITTGQTSHLRNIYKNSVGPNLSELFFQSNFGIVLEATVQLLARPEQILSYNIMIAEEKNLPGAVQVVRQLIEQGTLQGVPHIFDRERLYSTFRPVLEREIQKRGLSFSQEIIIQKYFSGSWWVVGSLQGQKSVVKAKARELKKALSPFGKVQIMNPKHMPIIKRMARVLKMQKIDILLEATEKLRGLSYGCPSNDSLLGVFHPYSQKLNYNELPDVDDSPTGYLFVCPGIPLAMASMQKLLSIISRYRTNAKSKIAISVNPINASVGEGVISFSFPRNDPHAVAQAKLLEKMLRTELKENGFGFLRLGINQYEEMQPIQYLISIKDIFDTHNVISPTRYNLRMSRASSV